MNAADGQVLYRCPSCGHEEMLDPCDWQESLPGCPIVVVDTVNVPPPDEEDLTLTCPSTYMEPVE